MLDTTVVTSRNASDSHVLSSPGTVCLDKSDTCSLSGVKDPQPQQPWDLNLRPSPTLTTMPSFESAAVTNQQAADTNLMLMPGIIPFFFFFFCRASRLWPCQSTFQDYVVLYLL